MLDKQGELLRALDVEGLLRNDLLVVGTNAFAAYEVLCGVKFPAGNEPTQDFDLAWCRGSGVSLARLPKKEKFMPMVSLVEQEWLLCGKAAFVVVATQRHRACPLYVPDPRWMALHKLWLATKPERNAQKRPKDARQGEVLLDACRYFLDYAYPLNIDFVLDLPEELRDLFNDWAQRNGFSPTNA
jgi:hypothetical protein